MISISCPTSGRSTPKDWDAFRKTVVRPKHGPLRHPGEYAASTRKRRKQGPQGG